MFISRPNEILDHHIELVLNQYQILNDKKNIDIIIDNTIMKLCKENKSLNGQEKIVKSMFLEMLNLHDEGKKNPFFQSYIGNKEYAQHKFTQLNKHHAEISAIYYCIEMYNKYATNIKSIKERPIQIALADVILSFSYNIYSHHGNLKDLDKPTFVRNLITYYADNKEQFINIDLSNIECLYKFETMSKVPYKNPYTYYLLCKLSYSILITCDFMAVYSFKNKENLEVNTVDGNIKSDINKRFNNNKVIKSIRKFEKNPNLPLSILDRYRTEMFLESEIQLIRSKDKNSIFYLEAPTGCGKSLTSLNLAYNLLDDTINKIYYIAPFNNIAEQTHKVIKDSFYENVVTVNSREDVFISKSESQDEDDFVNYNKDFLNMQMINYPITLISHVRFFDVLFGNNRIKNLMFSNICNSVMIIDEIQSYKNSIWQHMINSLKEFAEILNLKIIIMSATLPKMQELIEDTTYKIPDLICNRDYYYNYFKQRVEFNFSLLKKDKNTKEEVFDKIDEVIRTTNKHRVLIECLTTASANEFYEEMKKYESKGFLVFKMTGITNSIGRNYIIEAIQSITEEKYTHKQIILVGTQCIEAGVDIDMQVGFKDISILDADEQFAGRIERNFKDVGTVYFFDIDDGDFIYRGDYRTEKNLKSNDWKEIFKNKNFSEFYKRNYKWLLDEDSDSYLQYKNDLQNLQYNKVHETMKLINSETYSILFMCKYENKDSSEDIWDRYINLKNEKLDFAEMQIKISSIKKELNNYIYNINAFKFKNELPFEKINELYIVRDGSEYFDNLTDDNELTPSSTLNVDKFCNYSSLYNILLT